MLQPRPEWNMLEPVSRVCYNHDLEKLEPACVDATSMAGFCWSGYGKCFNHGRFLLDGERRVREKGRRKTREEGRGAATASRRAARRELQAGGGGDEQAGAAGGTAARKEEPCAKTYGLIVRLGTPVSCGSVMTGAYHRRHLNATSIQILRGYFLRSALRRLHPT